MVTGTRLRVTLDVLYLLKAFVCASNTDHVDFA